MKKYKKVWNWPFCYMVCGLFVGRTPQAAGRRSESSSPCVPERNYTYWLLPCCAISHGEYQSEFKTKPDCYKCSKKYCI